MIVPPPPGDGDGAGVDAVHLHRCRLLLRPHLECSLDEPLALGSRSSRVVGHHPDVVVGVGLETDDERLVPGAPGQHILAVLHLPQVLAPVLDAVTDQLPADLVPDVGNRVPVDPDGGAVEGPGAHIGGCGSGNVLG